MVDFQQVKIIKELGAGMLGTTYLAVYNNKEYALKIQHILPKDRKKDFKNEMWRELDLYNFIEKLKPADQQFFTRMLGYEFVNNCTHIQKRPFKLNASNKWAKTLEKLDKSPWCVKYLTEFKGQQNLHDFLSHNKPSEKQVYSIMLQICKIVLILYKAGYSHNDLHPGNIMINSTSEKYFMLNKQKVNYHGYQITAIDYGNVMHRKFGIKYKDWLADFLNDRKKWLFRELFQWCYIVFTNEPKNIYECKRQKKKLPWEHGGDTYEKATKHMIKNHPMFYKVMLAKYLRVFPKARKLFKKINTNKSWRRMDKHPEFWMVINRIVDEFSMEHPKEYTKYWKWCSLPAFLLPKKDVQDILKIKTSSAFVKHLLKKI